MKDRSNKFRAHVFRKSQSIEKIAGSVCDCESAAVFSTTAVRDRGGLIRAACLPICELQKGKHVALGCNRVAPHRGNKTVKQ